MVDARRQKAELGVGWARSGDSWGSVTIRREWRSGIFLSLAAALITLFALEVGLRLAVRPSLFSSGRLAGVELPPVSLFLPEEAPDPPASDALAGPVVRDTTLSYGDLGGAPRPDPRIGYAPLEGFESLRGWWRTNSLGARADGETPPEVPEGRIRILVFGDSFAAGSRLPQDETWSMNLAALDERLDIVNFGVDGYGTGQAFLRYQDRSGHLEHDVVLLMVVPAADLWRDVNVRRDLGEAWSSWTVMPRFVVATDGLELIPDPLSAGSMPQADRVQRLEVLEDHVRRYDHFFREDLYELPPVVGHSVLFRIALAALDQWESRDLRRHILLPESEAVRVTAGIVGAMRAEVERSGRQFVLVLAPTGHELARSQLPTPDADAWHDLAAALCEGAGTCIDLIDAMMDSPASESDFGYDGTHYGPKTSRRLAEVLLSELRAQGLVPERAPREWRASLPSPSPPTRR
jgi:hypothetical protein